MVFSVFAVNTLTSFGGTMAHCVSKVEGTGNGDRFTVHLIPLTFVTSASPDSHLLITKNGKSVLMGMKETGGSEFTAYYGSQKMTKSQHSVKIAISEEENTPSGIEFFDAARELKVLDLKGKVELACDLYEMDEQSLD